MAGCNAQDSPERFQDEPWPAVRQGLRTYRAGLIAKIIVVVAGFSLLLLAGLARAPGAARTALVIFSMGGLLTTIWMVTGLFGYARVPKETGGRGGVIITLVLILLGFLLDIYSLILVGHAFSGRRSAVAALLEYLPHVDAMAQVLGILGIMALLFSIRKVAMYAESTTLRSRIGVVAGLLTGVAVCSFAVRALVAEMVIRAEALLPLAIIILAAAIVGLVLYLGILRDLLKDISARD